MKLKSNMEDLEAEHMKTEDPDARYQLGETFSSATV